MRGGVGSPIPRPDLAAFYNPWLAAREALAGRLRLSEDAARAVESGLPVALVDHVGPDLEREAVRALGPVDAVGGMRVFREFHQGAGVNVTPEAALAFAEAHAANAQALLLAADALARSGSRRDGARLAGQAVLLAPSDPDVLVDAASLQFQAGETREAEALCRRVLLVEEMGVCRDAAEGMLREMVAGQPDDDTNH